MDSLDIALEKAKEQKHYFSSGGVSDESINKAEKILGLNFSKMQRKFYKNSNYMGFEGEEFMGIYLDELDSEYYCNSVAKALKERKFNLLDNWLPFYNYGYDGYLACFDFSDLGEDGEPPVILVYYNGEKYLKTEKLADNIGDFILNIINGKY